jgi:hypothetical protein
VRPEDLAGREVDQPLERPGLLRCLEHVRGAEQIHSHRPHRALQHRVDARDRRQVDDVRGACGQLAQQRQVEHVALDEAQVLVLGQVGAGQRVAVQVVEHDDLVLRHETTREGGTDEARTARHEDLLAAQSHDRPVYPRDSAKLTA